jgi:radical SAM superfamily enzyme YgiQ (UPF0313 family)
VFKNALGEIVHTAERSKIRDINSLPFPDRGAISFSPYLETWKKAHGKSTVSVSTMRGCPYTCKWCSRAVYGLSYRRRSPALVVKELLDLKEKYHPDLFWFVDDVFTISHEWLKEFRSELVHAGLTIAYECITRSDRMNEEVLSVLKETGCFRVWIGAESGSQKVLDLMDRRVQAEQVRDMIIKTKASGIEAGTFIMLGYPGEKLADIEETRKHLLLCLPDQITITLAYPITGTPFFQEIQPSVTFMPPWEESSDREIRFKRPFSDAFYQNAVRWIINSVEAEKCKVSGKKLKSFWLRLKAGAARRKMR